MNAKDRAHDVHCALQRAKRKMSSLMNELSEKESCSEGEDELRGLAHSKELRDSLVEMYKESLKEVAARRKEKRLQRNSRWIYPLTQGSQLPRSELNSSAREPERKMEDEEGYAVTVDSSSQAEQDAGPHDRTPLSTPRDHTAPPPKSSQEGLHVIHASDSFTSERHPPVLDREKNISFLLKKLDSLRDLNKKLQDRLALQDTQLEKQALDAQLLQDELEARVCEKAGALVEEIYNAQRERDQAMMARLRLANEERDEALLRARRLQQAAAELENINPEENDADLEELLNRINNDDSALGIERNGAVIVDRLQKARERRKKITAEEMNAIIEERDAALAKCRRLEQDLHLAEVQSPAQANSATRPSAENSQEHAYKERLDAVIREHNMALERNHSLEEEIQTLRAHCSPNQPVSKEVSLKDQFDSKLGTNSEAQLSQVAQTSHHQEELTAQIQALASEHQNTQAQLRLAREAEKEANEKIQKLERLVEVLRKKVGTGSVRTVI